ncbi:MAG: hypothetical protein ISR84_04795 [Kiritimatiellales bacterium]|nr:hypothetical protein [Kiritimatiellales bacterium]
MNDHQYIDRLKKNIRNPRAKLYQKLSGGVLVLFGVFMLGNMSWAFYQIDRINETETKCMSLLADEDLSTEDTTKVVIALHELIPVRIKMNNYASGVYPMLAGSFIGFGITMFCGYWTKRNELIVSLWDKVEALENQQER